MRHTTGRYPAYLKKAVQQRFMVDALSLTVP